MREHQVKPPRGATQKRSKRLGRGLGSGSGTYSGKGMKGQKARSGVRMRPGFEGGQNPLIKKLPHQRGFTNRFRVEYQVVNVEALDRFDDGTEITVELLREVGLVRHGKNPVKVLGNGDLKKKLTVRVHRVSGSARKKIEAAKGAAEELDAATIPTV